MNWSKEKVINLIQSSVRFQDVTVVDYHYIKGVRDCFSVSYLIHYHNQQVLTQAYGTEEQFMRFIKNLLIQKYGNKVRVTLDGYIVQVSFKKDLIRGRKR